MRDLESIQITLTLAETGHLVFATLHTNDAARRSTASIDVFPSDKRDQIQIDARRCAAGRHLASACCRRSAAVASRPTRC